MSLEERLRGILDEVRTDFDYHEDMKVVDQGDDVFIVQVIQAFKDEGYIKTGRHDRVNERLREKVSSGELMTGADWVRRFMEFMPSNLETIPRNTLEMAARKASGL